MGGKWQIVAGNGIIRMLIEKQAFEELHEVNNHQEELGGSGYSSRETPNRQTQMNKKNWKDVSLQVERHSALLRQS